MNKHLNNELKQWVHFWKKFTLIILTKDSSLTSIQNGMVKQEIHWLLKSV